MRSGDCVCGHERIQHRCEFWECRKCLCGVFQFPPAFSVGSKATDWDWKVEKFKVREPESGRMEVM